MPDDDTPAPESGYVRLPGRLDTPTLLAAAVLAEADRRKIPWQHVVNQAIAAWELARRRRPGP